MKTRSVTKLTPRSRGESFLLAWLKGWLVIVLLISLTFILGLVSLPFSLAGEALPGWLRWAFAITFGPPLCHWVFNWLYPEGADREPPVNVLRRCPFCHNTASLDSEICPSCGRDTTSR
ncbi:MAG: hypothetical protein EBS05_05850 [Proteobacteria bacterium]|nr:hypothetical protein [Pseudomonadota bacterium]